MKSSLVLTLILSTIMFAMFTSTVNAQAVYVTLPAPRVSAPNQMVNFYVGGSSEGYTLRASPQGGSLSIDGYGVTSLMPWGYATAKWSTGYVYIIFLVNVTQTDFRIGFLYLTNSTDQPFILRWFDYNQGNSPSMNNWTFQGAQHVYNRTVMTTSVTLPKLQFPLSTTLTNGISVLGSQLYLTSDSGQLLNGTKNLKISPLMNQLFGGPNDYNEVWTLLNDSAGNYYFAILYMKNGDPSHVIIEHVLRLNDYRKLDGITLNAKWVKGDFSNQVTVRTRMPSFTVKIDGFPFQTNTNGVASTGVPYGMATVEVPNEIIESPNSKLKFITWDRYGTSNPLSILVNSTLDITATYNHAYPLSITSSYSSALGSGWYTQGTNATFAVQNDVIDYGNNTKRVFKQWEGDSNSTRYKAWTIINSPKQVKASWTTQYAVTINAVGLPANASTITFIGNSQVTLNGSLPYKQWVDANQQLPIKVQSTEIQSASNNYVFSRIIIDNQILTGALNVKKPVAVSIVYTGTPKLGTSITLQVSPSVAAPGLPLSITGSIGGVSSNPTFVDILYNSANNGWERLASVPVKQNGGFTYTWQAETPGNYYLKASWPGDSNHSPASQTVTVKVLDSSNPIGASSDVVTQFLKTIITQVENFTPLSPLISLAATMMTLGLILTTSLIPAGPPIIGHLMGSLLVGFIIIFPASTIIVLLNAVRTHRGPSLLWLTPLLGLWLSTFALVLLQPENGLLQPLTVASQPILLLTTALLFPLMATFQLVKLVEN